MLVSWTGSAGKLKMIGRDSVNRQHHPTQSTTTYRVNRNTVKGANTRHFFNKLHW